MATSLTPIPTRRRTQTPSRNSDVYNLVLSEVEPPLLEAVLRYTRNNQTKASTVLGMNRGTLRKKLKQYELL